VRFGNPALYCEAISAGRMSRKPEVLKKKLEFN